MSERNYHAKVVKKKKSKSGNFNLNKNALINDSIEQYLSGDREEALEILTKETKLENLNQLKPFLKKSISQYVSHFYKDFNANINIKSCIYEMFDNFDAIDFMARQWQYKPYFVSNADYQKIQNATKNPIFLTHYDYLQPLYTFSNSFVYKDKKYKRVKDKIKNDVQFYLSQNEDIMCAKIINIRYRPANLKMVGQKSHIAPKEIKPKLVYDNSLYQRSFSISMYVLLDGDPKKAMPYLRYDNDNTPHTNLYIGDDKRRKIFGKTAKNPHFHFQNEDDSLLCLRNFKDNNGRTKYKTGRCNAIDCPHLKNYLIHLDNLSQYDIQKQLEENQTYNMPFLHIKAKGKALNINVDEIISNYISQRSQEERELLIDITSYLEQTKDNPLYKNSNNKCFGKLIKSLDLLDYLVSIMQQSTNYNQRKLFSHIEIMIANNVINAIDNNNTKIISHGNQPKYEIDGDYLC